MDWVNDFLLRVVGICLGTALFGFVLAPLLGLQFGKGHTATYMLMAATATLCGYAVRFGVRRWVQRKHS